MAVITVHVEVLLSGGGAAEFLIDSDDIFIVDSNGDLIQVNSDQTVITQDLTNSVFGGKWAVFCVPARRGASIRKMHIVKLKSCHQ